MPASTETLVDVRTLIDRPGATLSLDRRLPTPADLGDELATLGPQVTVDGIVESVVDGVLVRGTVTAPVTLACARCLAERDASVTADVVELFSTPEGIDDPVAEAGYEIVDATIDLDTMVRDALAEVVGDRPLCHAGCEGLCPVCGADRNIGADGVDPTPGWRRQPQAAPCPGHPEPRDARWSALADLQLPDAR